MPWLHEACLFTSNLQVKKQHQYTHPSLFLSRLHRTGGHAQAAMQPHTPVPSPHSQAPHFIKRCLSIQEMPLLKDVSRCATQRATHWGWRGSSLNCSTVPEAHCAWRCCFSMLTKFIQKIPQYICPHWLPAPGSSGSNNNNVKSKYRWCELK